MKVSQLKETIRAKVRETLYVGANALPAAMKDPAYSTLPPAEKIKITNTLKQKQSVNLEETTKYTTAEIWKMTRAELVDFLGLTSSEATKYSTHTLQGMALELADDKDKDLDEVEDIDLSQGFMPTANLSKMSRQEMLGILKLDPDTPKSELSDEDLRIGLKVYGDMYSKLNEKLYLDDDDAIHEDVEDVDGAGSTFKDYDEIYEGDFEPNVAPGSVYQISVKPINDRLISISQDNGQQVVVHVEDINQLIKVLQDLT